MTSTERKVFEIISAEKKVSIFGIAQKMGISTDYARLVCQGLERHGYINISGIYCSIYKSVPATKEKDKKKRIFQKISKKSKRREKQKIDSLSNLKAVNKGIAKILRKAGYKNIEEIASTPFSIFIQKTGVKLGQAAKIFNEARKKIGRIE